MNWLLYTVIVALLFGQIMQLVALFFLWRKADRQQAVVHHVLTALKQQAELNTIVEKQLAALNKTLRRLEADARAVAL